MGWLKKVGVGIGAVLGLGVLTVGALVGYAAIAAEKKLIFPDTPYPAIAASTDPEMIERGRYLVYGPAHCAQCHSTPDRDHPELIATTSPHGGLAFEMGIATTWSANLTPDPEVGIGRYSDQEIARVIRTGVLPDGSLSIFMSLSAAKPADEDIAAILSYLRSLPPEHNAVPKGEWSLMGKVVLMYLFPKFEPKPVQGPRWAPAADEPSVERGEYLAENLMLCTACHTEFDMSTFAPVGPKAGGGGAEASHGKDSDKEFAPPNLTSHPTGITGKWSEEQFVARLKAGRVYATSVMPWENIVATTDGDLRSVYRYLRTLPPVDRDTGPGYRDIGWKPEAK